MKDLAKGLLAPIIVFAILMLLGWFVIDRTTGSAAILDQTVSASTVAGEDPFAIPSGGDVTAPAEGQIQTYLEDIAGGLFNWVIIVTGTGWICAVLWFGASTVMQSNVVGPSGQSKAFPTWVGCATLYAAICAGAYFYFIEPLGIDDTMDDSLFWAFVGLAAVLGLIAYWIATAIAASPVMKPSVPLAARKARS